MSAGSWVPALIAAASVERALRILSRFTLVFNMAFCVLTTARRGAAGKKVKGAVGLVGVFNLRDNMAVGKIGTQQCFSWQGEKATASLHPPAYHVGGGTLGRAISLEALVMPQLHCTAHGNLQVLGSVVEGVVGPTVVNPHPA